MSLVEDLVEPHWYRGTGESSYDLTPGLYRHPVENSIDKLLDIESNIMKRFKQRSLPYLESPLRMEDDLDTMFLMQHYGVPTRLLDWTESPYIALFFAVSSAPYDKQADGSRLYTKDAAVWVLNPDSWNNKALGMAVPQGVITPPDSKTMSAWMPEDISKYGMPDPIAIYGNYNSVRIVAQRGVFTLAGKSVEPMNKIYESENKYDNDVLMRLDIPSANIGDMINTLTSTGITDSVIYPDLGGLATELKRNFNYWC